MNSLKTYLRIVRYAFPYWKQISVSIVCTIIFSLFSGASIYLFIPLLDILFRQENATMASSGGQGISVPLGLGDALMQIKKEFMAVVFAGTQVDALSRICVILVVAFFLKNLFGYLQSYFMSYAEEGVIKDLRNDLYRHLHHLPLGYFSNERTGKLISRITNDVTVINGGVSAFFVTMIREPLLIVVFLGLAFPLGQPFLIDKRHHGRRLSSFARLGHGIEPPRRHRRPAPLLLMSRYRGKQNGGCLAHLPRKRGM